MSDAELDDTTHCPVCLEPFDTTRVVPRLMPCSHSACAKCLEELLVGNGLILVCPQCRKRHVAGSGLQSFPENKYVFKILQRMLPPPPPPPPPPAARKFTLCEIHNGERELSLYCKSTGCEVAICQLCMINNHNGHKVVDIVDEESKKLTGLKDLICQCKATLSTAKQKVNENCEERVRVLQQRKNEVLQHFDTLIEDTKNHLKNEEKEIEKQLKSMDGLIEKFNTMNQTMKSRTNYKEPALKNLDELEQNVRDVFKEKFGYVHFECPDVQRPISGSAMDAACGRYTKKRELMDLPWLKFPIKFTTHSKYFIMVRSRSSCSGTSA